MRKLSVTEYLIAANQQQSTVTTYRTIGAAIDALVGEVDGSNLTELDRLIPSEHIANRAAAYAPSADDAVLVHAYRVGHYAYVGELYAWQTGDLATERYIYTIQRY